MRHSVGTDLLFHITVFIVTKQLIGLSHYNY